MGYYLSINEVEKKVKIIYDSPQYFIACTAIQTLTNNELTLLVKSVSESLNDFERRMCDFPNTSFKIDGVGVLVHLNIPGENNEEGYPTSLIYEIAKEYLEKKQSLDKKDNELEGIKL